MPTTSTPERHPVPDRAGVYIFQQRRSRYYYVEAFIDGRKIRKSLRTDRFATACKLAIDWHKRLLKESRITGPRKLDRLATDPTIAELYDSWRKTLSPAKRTYAAMKWSTIELFWRTIEVQDITSQTFREFFKWRRARKTPQGTIVKNHSIHKDVMIIRQIMKYGIEDGHITVLPLIPKAGKIDPNPRPWFNEPEWKHLLAVSARRIKEAAGNPKVQRQRQDCDDFIRFMVAAMCRVGELRNLRFGDCRLESNTKKVPILYATVTGKRGSREIVIRSEAVDILTNRWTNDRFEDDLVFPEHHRDAFRELLIAANLRKDAAWFPRNFKSVRATAISQAILRRTPLLFVARNAGVAYKVIDQYYAKRLDATMAADDLTN